jgi:hypothetical protein
MREKGISITPGSLVSLLNSSYYDPESTFRPSNIVNVGGDDGDIVLVILIVDIVKSNFDNSTPLDLSSPL